MLNIALVEEFAVLYQLTLQLNPDPILMDYVSHLHLLHLLISLSIINLLLLKLKLSQFLLEPLTLLHLLLLVSLQFDLVTLAAQLLLHFPCVLL